MINRHCRPHYDAIDVAIGQIDLILLEHVFYQKVATQVGRIQLLGMLTVYWLTNFHFKTSGYKHSHHCR
ncbi:hypothetical protein D3C85_1220280 [compost metagenome]